jgi:hypothetical protein
VAGPLAGRRTFRAHGGLAHDCTGFERSFTALRGRACGYDHSKPFQGGKLEEKGTAGLEAEACAGEEGQSAGQPRGTACSDGTHQAGVCGFN